MLRLTLTLPPPTDLRRGYSANPLASGLAQRHERLIPRRLPRQVEPVVCFGQIVVQAEKSQPRPKGKASIRHRQLINTQYKSCHGVGAALKLGNQERGLRKGDSAGCRFVYMRLNPVAYIWCWPWTVYINLDTQHKLAQTLDL